MSYSEVVDTSQEVGLVAFVEFLRAKGISDACELCGQDSGWSVAAADSRVRSRLVDLAIPYLVRDESQPGEYRDVLLFGRPVIHAECKNCGHVRLFSKSVVLDWVTHEYRGGDDSRLER